MKLPAPSLENGLPVARAIALRRTVRRFAPTRLDLQQFAQLNWAAHGITGRDGYKRAAPSAGALYPMDLYAVLGRNSVEGFKAGVYRYDPAGHLASLIAGDDRREKMARAALGQMWMAEAPVSFVITAEYERVAIKYGERGVRYAMIEAGHIGENIFLQAVAMGLRAGIVGAFVDPEITRVLCIPEANEPLLLMPVGHGR